MTTRPKTTEAGAFLQRLAGPLTLGSLLEAIRLGEGWSQQEMGRRLRLSRAHLCDIEKGRRSVSPERAARFARVLGYSEPQFVQLALQGMVDHAGLRLRVAVKAA